jgi:putative hemolysin
MSQLQADRIFNLDIKFKDPIQNRLFSLVKGPVEHFLALPRLNRVYADIGRMEDSRPFSEKILELLNVNYDLNDQDLSKLMISTGPVIVVANHPFGGIEGIILASLLRSIRCDVKFMANHLLNAIPEMRDMLISVNPFKQENAIRENIKPLRECIHWVKNGGMLVVFPAGTVSHFNVQTGTITDPEWSPSIAGIIRKTGASVIPVFFQGSNSAAFHMAGMVHPALRTAMLPNELFNKGRKNIQVRVGDVIPFEKLTSFTQDSEMTEYLRLRTYLLELRRVRRTKQGFLLSLQTKKGNGGDDIMPPQSSDIMAEELSLLTPSQTLVESGDYVVMQATADQLPHVLLEIGRLREITFRAAGEGTGKSIDLDRFDQTYIHLFIWNRAKQEVVGSYRLGKSDELVKKYGIKGLYTSTLFRYKPEFIEHMGHALEMGRSFVRIEYQKSFAPLLLLWRGIGRFIVDNPHYKTLFGPVSITDGYHALSKQLIVKFLKMNRFRDDMDDFVKARKPPRPAPLRGWDIDSAVRITKDDIDDISELISCIEMDRKGLPILLKQYLKLGGRVAGFNVDPAFGNVIDGLIMVDLTKTEQRLLDRYMGREGTALFLAHHETMDRDRYATCA